MSYLVDAAYQIDANDTNLLGTKIIGTYESLTEARNISVQTCDRMRPDGPVVCNIYLDGYPIGAVDKDNKTRCHITWWEPEILVQKGYMMEDLEDRYVTREMLEKGIRNEAEVS